MDGRRSTHGHEQPRLAFVVSSSRQAAPDTQPFTAHISIITQLGGCEESSLMIVAAKRVGVQKVHNALLGSARQQISIFPTEPDRTRGSEVQVAAIQI